MGFKVFAIFFYIFGCLQSASLKSGKPIPIQLSCTAKARACTEYRLGHHPNEEIDPIFQDALFHYCLDLYNCQEGRIEICHNVPPTENEYPDPNLRRALVKKCNAWKITIKPSRDDNFAAHYLFKKVHNNFMNSTAWSRV